MVGNLFKRFRISKIDGPSARGSLEQFQDYFLDIELDPGGVYQTQSGRLVVTLFLTAFFALAGGDPREPAHSDEARARLAHHVIETLQVLLRSSAAVFPMRLQPTVEEVRNLRSVDPTRVEVWAWNDVPTEPPPKARRVFISCGQSSEAERELGDQIARLVRDRTGLDGYFAQNQQSLEGVTRHIFNAIHDSAGFIAVMHRRDQISQQPDEWRGSVWVEQEIAIAAFMAQSLGLRLPCRAYVQRDVRREGARGFILFNPLEFETSADVLSDLERFWPELRGDTEHHEDSGAA